MYGTLSTSQFGLATFEVDLTVLNSGKALQMGPVLLVSAGNFSEEHCVACSNAPPGGESAVEKGCADLGGPMTLSLHPSPTS